MAIQNAPLAVFNRGIVDPKALGRIDIERIALSAETQTNWMPRIIGSMGLRPGLEKIINSLNDSPAKHIPFVFSTDDFAALELTGGQMRAIINDTVLSRPNNTNNVLNGTFDSDLTSWTDSDETGCVSAFKTGGFMSLKGMRFNRAIRSQKIPVALATSSPGMLRATRPLLLSRAGRVTGTPSQKVQPAQHTSPPEHALRIVVERGDVLLNVGKASGSDEYIKATLGTGTHSLAFTPKGDFFIEVSTYQEPEALIDSIAIETGGDMIIPTPWAQSALANVRWAQSANVMFVAGDPAPWYKIERRNFGRSWSVVKYEPTDGPFRDQNITPITIKASATIGDVTLTASEALFTPQHVGALFKIESETQQTDVTVYGENQFGDYIKVTGTQTKSRIFSYVSTGTWVGTIGVQRSLDDGVTWSENITSTINVNTTNDDGFSNVDALYRFGFGGGDYTSGSATLKLSSANGSIIGHARITKYTSPTVVEAAVVTPLGAVDEVTTLWSESVFSDFRGWPSAVELFEGRLWWTGHDWIIGSVSDAFASFDQSVVGDSAPIVRTLASGPVDDIKWMLGMQRLLIGTEGSEVSIKSDALDAPLTTTAFTLKDISTHGSTASRAVKVDTRGLFVSRSQFRLIELKMDSSVADYTASDMSLLVPDIGSPGFTHIAVQHEPDTRIHCVRSDGTVGMFLYDPLEDIKAWINIETDGLVEDVFTLPGKEEDLVYYSVVRVINGANRRFLERWAKESATIGGTVNEQADCFIRFKQTASATITGLDHLEGESVIVWADGKCMRDTSDDIATFTVSNGSISVTNDGSSQTVSEGIVGLPYTADFLSAKLPYGANLGTELGQRQRVSNIGFLLSNTHHRGLLFGPDFDSLDPLPQVIEGAAVSEDTIHGFLEEGGITFPGETDFNARLALRAKAPRPATVLASPLGLETVDHAP